MNTTSTAHRSASTVASLLLLLGAVADAAAQTSPAPTTTAKPPAKVAAAKAAKPVVSAKTIEPAPAGAEQVEASSLVYLGAYACEFNQTIEVSASPKYSSYINLKHAKADYLMKPVLSSTGAIRLEDVRGETLLVQISNKSMLLNVKTSQRIVDDCVSEKQREAVAAANIAKSSGALTPMLSAPVPK